MKVPLLFFTGLVFYYNCFSQKNIDTSFNVFFKTNSFELNAYQLDSLKGFLNTYPIITCIRGYADSTGTWANNLVLSKKRAFAVYAISKESSDSLKIRIVKYYGESKIFPELWMNRRVQICGHKPVTQPKQDTSIQQGFFTPLVILDSTQENHDTIRVINLQNLYFYPDKAVLTEESKPYLEELTEQLKAYSSATFDIIGHINYQSRFDSTHLRDLYQLSEQRAKAVFDYLAEHGFAAERMKYKGVGNSQPLIASPKNDDERKKNMRVQVIIIRK